jgi:hypothetical protein
MGQNLTMLTDLETKEVSLVDKGANRKKRFPITKAEGFLMDEKIIEAVLKTEVDEEKNLPELLEKAKLSPKGVMAVKAALRILSGFKEELPSNIMGVLSGLSGGGTPTTEAKEQPKPTDKKDMKEMDDKEIKKALDSIPVEVKKHYEEIEKANKANEEKIEVLKTQNEDIAKALQEEKDKRELAVWVSKAEKELGFVPDKSAQELGESLKKMADKDPALAEELFKNWQTVSKSLEKSEIFQEAGSQGASDGVDAWSKIEKAAAKAYPNEARYSAINKFLDTDEGKDLYSLYNIENPAQTGAR